MNAVYIAEDTGAVASSLRNGKVKINNLKDDKGKKMSDRRLLERLAEKDSRVIGVYQQCSGYIHHSEKSFYAMTHAEENHTIELNIGYKPGARYNNAFLECAEAFAHYTKLQHFLTAPFVDAKNKYEELFSDN